MELHPLEKIPASEENDTRIIIEMMKGFLRKKYSEGETLRHFHPKMHGCLKATFSINENIPEELKVGLFKTQKNYEAWVRFSNAPPAVKSDKRATGRGLAIKVMEVEGDVIEADSLGMKTQDFVMTTSPVLSVGTVKNYKNAIGAITQGFPKNVFFGLNPKHWRMIGITLKHAKKHSNLLSVDYFTGSPFLYGEGKAVRFSAQPQNKKDSKYPKTSSNHFLKERLIVDIGTKEQVFDICIQFHTDPKTEPIEDTSVVWKTVFQKVAELRIPKQEFAYQKRIVFGENLSFSPWKCLTEHRPLGGINRSRRNVYKSLAAYRKIRNGIAD